MKIPYFLQKLFKQKERTGAIRGYYKTTKEWADNFPYPERGRFEQYVELHPKLPFNRTAPKTLEPRVNRRFAKCQLPRKETEVTFVAYMRNGRVCGALGDVITPENKFLWDVTTLTPKLQLGPEKHWLFQQNKIPSLRKIDGLVANLSGDWPDNYHHWLVEILPRLELIQLSGVNLNSIDTFLFNTLDRAYQQATLLSFGISADRIVTTTASTHYQCSELLVPSFIRGAGCGIGWIYQFLRRQFLEPLPAIEGQPTRIYICRSQASVRHVKNEDALIAFLAGYGFQAFHLETLDFFEQIRLFANAEVVVGPHGAGLTNLVFSKPHTKVVEFTMPDRIHYWALCDELGLDYYYINGFPELSEEFTDSSWQFNDDMRIDMNVLERTLNYAHVERSET